MLTTPRQYMRKRYYLRVAENLITCDSMNKAIGAYRRTHTYLGEVQTGWVFIAPRADLIGQFPDFALVIGPRGGIRIVAQ